MKIIVGAVLTAVLLLSGSLVFAAPKQLTNGQLGSISAGSMMDYFLPVGQEEEAGQEIEVDGIAVADCTSIATVGDDNTYANVSATEDGIATVGYGNTVVDQGNYVEIEDGTDENAAVVGTGNIVRTVDQSGSGFAVDFGDNATFGINVNAILAEVEEGSAAVAGNDNEVSINTDDTDIDGYIGPNGYGVIAKEATVTDSFNTEVVNTCVDVDIKDSFNVETNTLDISGQTCLSAIINANTLEEQNIGANLNVTSAVCENEYEDATGIGSATASTFLVQVVINNSLIAVAAFDNLMDGGSIGG